MDRTLAATAFCEVKKHVSAFWVGRMKRGEILWALPRGVAIRHGWWMNSHLEIAATVCALCGAPRKLKRGHILPQFVYRWQFANTPAHVTKGLSRRELDGPTRPMLCGSCEDLFARGESEFARGVFHPFVTRGTVNAKYRAWLHKFAASVGWRILENEVSASPAHRGAVATHSALAACRETWAAYLTGQRADVGAHTLHLVPVAAFFSGDNGGATQSGEWAAWADFSIEMAVVDDAPGAFVYAKLGPWVIFGLIDAAAAPADDWRGTQIHAEGKLKPRDLRVPLRYLAYVRARAASGGRSVVSAR